MGDILASQTRSYRKVYQFWTYRPILLKRALPANIEKLVQRLTPRTAEEDIVPWHFLHPTHSSDYTGPPK